MPITKWVTQKSFGVKSGIGTGQSRGRTLDAVLREYVTKAGGGVGAIAVPTGSRVWI